jgi:Zn-dependent protease with chaperone function
MRRLSPNNLLVLCNETSLSFLLLYITTIFAITMAYSQTVINLRQGFPIATSFFDGRDGLFSAFVAIPGALVYAMFASIKIRRRDGGSLQPREDDTLSIRVRELSERLGISSPAIFIANKGFDQSAQAFGFFKSALRLGRGMRALLQVNKPVFDSILMHELAHIKNMDVRKAYVTRGLIKIYCLLIGIILFVLHGVVVFNALHEHWCSNGISYCVTAVARILSGNTLAYVPMLIVVAICYALFIRLREYQADYTASLHGAKNELIKIFDRAQQIPTGLMIRALLSLHPSPKQRKRALERPSTIFKATRWMSFVAGCLLAIIQQCVAKSQSIELLSSGAVEHWKRFLDGQDSMTLSLFLRLAAVAIGSGVILYSSLLILSLSYIRLGMWARSSRRILLTSFFQCITGAMLFVVAYEYVGDFIVYLGMLVNFGARQYYLATSLSDAFSEQALRSSATLLLIFLSFFLGLAFSKLILTLRFPRIFIAVLCFCSIMLTILLVSISSNQIVEQFSKEFGVPDYLLTWQSFVFECGEVFVILLLVFAVDRFYSWRQSKRLA